MNKIRLTKKSGDNQIKAYFEKVSRLHDSGEEFPVDLDDVFRLIYSQKGKALEVLRNEFFFNEDYYLYQSGKVLTTNKLRNGIRVDVKMSVPCLEYFIVRKVRSVFEIYRQVFHAARRGELSTTHKFVQRFNVNYKRLNKGYFSVVSELYIRLYGKFEMNGYTLPDYAITGTELRPDVSVGKLFSNYLKKNHPKHSKDFKFYNHLFPELDLEVKARQYPNYLLPTFIWYVDNVWIPEKAQKYLSERDPKALEYLPKLLAA